MAEPVAIKDSILASTKRALGLEDDYDAFDIDIIMHINSVFSTLHQLGVGPDDPFEIEDRENTWVQFLGTNKLINSVKTYIYQKVRLIFDPPASSFGLNSIEKMITEAEWRLNVASEKYAYLDPSPTGEYPFEIPQNMLWNLTGGIDFPDIAPIGASGIDLTTGLIWKKTS